jgi:hypothetical protein
MPSDRDSSFSASYDSTTKIISAVVLVLFLGIVAATHSVVAGCLTALIVVGAYAWSPRGYREAGKFVVEVREKWSGPGPRSGGSGGSVTLVSR